MITANDFRERFPEFCDKTEYSDVRVEMFIADSVDDMGDDELRWDTKYDRAQAYLVAHLLTQGTKSEYGDTGSAAPIISKSAGGVSVTKAGQDLSNKTTEEIELMSTTYGVRFIAIRKQCFFGILVATIDF